MNTIKLILVRRSFVGLAIFLAVFSLVALAPAAMAAEKCSFTRDLELGSDGEDVRCLQKYLNASGVTIAATGVGSPGHETTLFRALTQEAVMRWQMENGVSPATGYFGAISRAKYAALVQGTVITPSSPTAPSSAAEQQIANLLKQIQTLQAQVSTGGGANMTNTVTGKKILAALEQLERAEDEVEDALDHGQSIGRAEDEIADARREFYEAVAALIAGNMPRAQEFSDRALDNAADAFEDAGGETEEDEVEGFINEVEDKIELAWNDVEAANDDGEDVDESEDLLEEAEDRLDEADDAFDEENFDEANDLAEEAEDLVADALDAIGEGGDPDENDAEDAIDDATDAIEDAWIDVNDADDDGQDVSNAEDLLDEAEDLLNDAEDAFDDEDYDEVIDLTDEIQDLVDEALDEI